MFSKQVVMGGGKKSFAADNAPSTAKDISGNPDKNMCVRTDGRNLIDEWIRDKQTRRLSYRYLTNANDMRSLDAERTEYVLGGYYLHQSGRNVT